MITLAINKSHSNTFFFSMVKIASRDFSNDTQVSIKSVLSCKNKIRGPRKYRKIVENVEAVTDLSYNQIVIHLGY